MASELRPTIHEHWKELFNLLHHPDASSEERLLSAIRFIGSLKQQGFSIFPLLHEAILESVSRAVFGPFLTAGARNQGLTSGCMLCRDVGQSTRVQFGHLVGRVIDCVAENGLASAVLNCAGESKVLPPFFRLFRRNHQRGGWVLLLAMHYPLHEDPQEAVRIIQRLQAAAPGHRALMVYADALVTSIEHAHDLFPASADHSEMFPYWIEMIRFMATGKATRDPIRLEGFIGEYSMYMQHSELATALLHASIRNGLADANKLIRACPMADYNGRYSHVQTFVSRVIRLAVNRVRGTIRPDIDIESPENLPLFLAPLTPEQRQAHTENPKAPIPYEHGTDLDQLLTDDAYIWSTVDFLAPAELALPFAEVDDAEFPPTRDVRRPGQIHHSLKAHAWEVCRMMPAGVEPWVVADIIYESMPQWVNPATGKSEFLDMSPRTGDGKTRFQLVLHEFVRKVLASFQVVRNRRPTQEMRMAALQVAGAGGAAGSSSYRKRAQQQQEDEDEEEEQQQRRRRPRLSTASAAAAAAPAPMAAAINPYLVPSVEDVEMEDVEMEDGIGSSVQRAPSPKE